LPFECLTYERKDKTCYLTLNRPDKLNALNAQLMAELREALDIIELDQEIRVVILTGAGRAFSAAPSALGWLGLKSYCSPVTPSTLMRRPAWAWSAG